MQLDYSGPAFGGPKAGNYITAPGPRYCVRQYAPDYSLINSPPPGTSIVDAMTSYTTIHEHVYLFFQVGNKLRSGIWVSEDKLKDVSIHGFLLSLAMKQVKKNNMARGREKKRWSKAQKMAHAAARGK